jgi:hypothetical protein
MRSNAQPNEREGAKIKVRTRVASVCGHPMFGYNATFFLENIKHPIIGVLENGLWNIMQSYYMV